jgi:hypothetical protein
MKTSHLLVEALFVASVLAHQDDENRLVLLASDALRGRPIGMPDRFLLDRLRGDQRRAARQADEEQYARPFHTRFSKT